MSDTGLDIRSRALGGNDAGALADFFKLLKPRVMSLVVFTGLVGMVMAPGPIHPVIAFASLLAIAIGAGAAGALNMWYDADIDALMQRTAMRPIPAGRIAAQEALTFGAFLSFASVFILGVLVNWMAAALLALTIGFYIFVYTMWLKRRTAQNIVIGGAAGSLPPVIGWACVTGTVSLEPLVLFAIIFLWTPSHFWALALYRARDYDRARIPMLPVVAGPEATKRQILLYAAGLVPVTLLPPVMGFAGPAYGVLALAMGGYYVALAWRLYRHDGAGDRQAKRVFAYSILYLFALFAAMLAERGFAVAPGLGALAGG